MTRLAVGLAMVCAAMSAFAQQDTDRNVLGRISQRTALVEACPKYDESEEEGTARASEHYERGRELYEQGDYADAISEFVSAYCHRLHPAMLKNIAQAYERQVDYEKAVGYLERYILELPEDETTERQRTSFRVDVLQELKARITVATSPKGANVTLTDENGVVAQARADEEEPLQVRRGNYKMTVELPGYTSYTKDITAEIGRPYSYFVRLDPLVGQLRISARPSNARLFIGDRLVGFGNHVGELPAGNYRLTVEAAGHPSGTSNFEIRPNKTTVVRMALKKPPRSGRLELLVGSTIFGGVFGTSTLQTLFENQSLSAIGGVAGLGIGFAGGYFGVPRDITVGDSSLIAGSTVIAAAEAALIAGFIACSASESADGTFTNRCSDEASKIVGGAALAAGTVGLLGGTLLAAGLDMDAGRMALIHSGGFWGATTGALFYSVFDNDPRLLEPFIFVGLNLGLASTAILSTRLSMSRGRSALIDLSGLAGIVAGAAAAQAAEATGTERLDHFALLGMTAGLITGAFLTRNMDIPALEPAAGVAHDVTGNTVSTFGAVTRF